jgi:hypothetical protein
MNDQLVATILAGQSLSDAVAIGGFKPVALLMPAAWDTALVTFQASYDGVAYGVVVDLDNTEFQLNVPASRWVSLPAAPFSGARYIKVRSGVSGIPVNQAADRAITIITEQAVSAISRLE